MATDKSEDLAEIQPADPVPVNDRSVAAVSSRAQRRRAGQRSDKTTRVLRAEAYWTVRAQLAEQAKPEQAAETHARYFRRVLRKVERNGELIRPAGFGAKHHRAELQRQAELAAAPPALPQAVPERREVTPKDNFGRIRIYVQQNSGGRLTARQLRALRKADLRALAAGRRRKAAADA